MLTPEELDSFLTSAAKVEQAAEQHLRTHPGKQSVIAFVRTVQRGVDSVVQNAMDQGAPIECRAGCSHCCSAKVEALAPEIFLLARELQRRPAEELNAVIQRLKEHVGKHSEATAWGQRSPCPFLTNNRCSIYEVRPSVCRKAHSLDVKQCEANAPEIPQTLSIAVGAEALMKGTSDAYGTLGFNTSAHELGRAVLMALTDPSEEARWYSGEAVFVTNVAD
jgi:Fe-S-cluster containining protein